MSHVTPHFSSRGTFPPPAETAGTVLAPGSAVMAGRLQGTGSRKSPGLGLILVLLLIRWVTGNGPAVQCRFRPLGDKAPCAVSPGWCLSSRGSCLSLALAHVCTRADTPQSSFPPPLLSPLRGPVLLSPAARRTDTVSLRGPGPSLWLRSGRGTPEAHGCCSADSTSRLRPRLGQLGEARGDFSRAQVATIGDGELPGPPRGCLRGRGSHRL